MSIFSQWVTSPGGRAPVELELPKPAPPPGEQAAEGADGTYVDRGMPIPEAYGVDVVRALVQDPFHLMVYWELRPESLRALEGLFPDGATAGFHPAMRLTEIDEGVEAYVSVPLAGKYWFEVTPDHRYRVDIGARSPEHGFVPIARSGVVVTPRGTVATTVAEDPRYRVETGRFVRLLRVTGFATDRVLTDVARADAAQPGEPVPAYELGAPPPYLVEAFHRLPEPVRAAAASVARGEQLDGDLLERLPDRIRRILELLRERDEQELLTAAFMHLLPQMLRQILDGSFVDESAHPLHLPPRFLLGGSEVLQRPRVDWSWMPSMAESTGRRTVALEPDALDPIPQA